MKRILTYSSMAKFMTCRRAFYWANEVGIKKIGPDATALTFGGLVHRCLENLYKGKVEEIHPIIDAEYVNRDSGPDQKKLWHYAKAIIEAYLAKYIVDGRDEFEPVEVEKEFLIDVPQLGKQRRNRYFQLAGKTDGVVRKDGQHFILEHKTSSRIDSGYMERIIHDFQSRLYSLALSKVLGIPISGVIYNVITKPLLKQNAKETDEVFHSRLVERVSEGLQREMFYYTAANLEDVASHIQEILREVRDCQKRGVWLKNTGNCYQWNRACDFFPICQSYDNPITIANQYEAKIQNEELVEVANAEEIF